MDNAPLVLKALLRQRHWTYSTFCKEYDKAAKQIDPALTGSWPSRAQYQRWLAGELRGLPYPDACRVLEGMFPDWRIEQLFLPCSDQQLAQIAGQVVDAAEPEVAEPPRLDVDQLIADRFSDVSAVYASRFEFMSSMPIRPLFDNARRIRLSGLSLNMLCQQYADHSMRDILEGGTSIECLFLDPDGSATRDREREEHYDAGRLAELTRLNINTLIERVRNRLSSTAKSKLRLATYNETIRFNITLIDDQIGIVQPYLQSQRGIESPTLVLHRRWENQGLFPIFEAIFTSLSEGSQEV